MVFKKVYGPTFSCGLADKGTFSNAIHPAFYLEKMMAQMTDKDIKDQRDGRL